MIETFNRDFYVSFSLDALERDSVFYESNNSKKRIFFWVLSKLISCLIYQVCTVLACMRPQNMPIMKISDEQAPYFLNFSLCIINNLHILDWMLKWMCHFLQVLKLLRVRFWFLCYAVGKDLLLSSAEVLQEVHELVLQDNVSFGWHALLLPNTVEGAHCPHLLLREATLVFVKFFPSSLEVFAPFRVRDLGVLLGEQQRWVEEGKLPFENVHQVSEVFHLCLIVNCHLFALVQLLLKFYKRFVALILGLVLYLQAEFVFDVQAIYQVFFRQSAQAKWEYKLVKLS